MHDAVPSRGESGEADRAPGGRQGDDRAVGLGFALSTAAGSPVPSVARSGPRTGSRRAGGVFTWVDTGMRRGGSPEVGYGITALVVTLVVTLAASVAVDVGRPAVLSYPTFEAALDTCAVIAAFAAAWAFCANFRQTRWLRDLVLGSGLVILIVVDLVSVLVPTVLGLRSATAIGGAPAPMIGGLLVSACFLAAARAPRTLQVDTGRRWGAIGIGAGVAAGVAVELAAKVLPNAHALSLSLLIAGVLISALAAVAFLAAAKRLDGGRDRDDAWVAPLFAAAVLLIVIGAEGTDWITLRASAPVPAFAGPAQVMWLAAFCLMSLGARRQLATQRRRTAAALAERDRQRLVRDLHDGICQDLAFIAAQGARIAADNGDDHPIAVAARRALAASRGTIAELSASDAASTAEALRRVADELAMRFGIAIDVRAQPVRLQPDDRDAVVRIMREAVVNAAKHGNARNVLVGLQIEEGRLVLRVRDDGRGFEPAQLRREGFGMWIMRERARELGGRLRARPGDDGGTELEMVVP